MSFTRHFLFTLWSIFTTYSIKNHLDERAKNVLNNTFYRLVTEGQIENGPYWDEKKDNRYKRHLSNLYHVDFNIYDKHENVYLC